MAYPNANLLDFWKSLWHVDVHKDHGNTYDANIVNSYLPNYGKYETTQEIDGFKISSAGQLSNRNGGDGKVLGFAELFKYLTDIDFADIQGKPVGYKTESMLNQELIGKSVSYQIEIFGDNGAGQFPSKLDEFIGAHNIALFVDTSSHLPELLQNYDKNKKIIYAYSREIESDPADKSTYLTIGKQNQNKYYYELEAPSNPTIIAYPPYSSDDSLSYFYCKYPVFLSNNGIKDSKKYNLKATLSYVRDDGKTITITDGANTAGAFDKFKNGLKRILGIGSDNDLKQIVFISKHHGDVAQSLVKFRDIQMKCPKTGEVINTADYKTTFVSIDVNAIIKALTIETPFIFMYPPDKKRIIVWKNNNLNSPAIQFESEKKFTNELQSRILSKLEKYEEDYVKVNINRALVLTKIEDNLTTEDILEGQPLEYYAAEYRKVLQTGVHLSTLLHYIPNEELKEVDASSFDRRKIIDSIIVQEGQTDEEILEQISILKGIQKYLSEKEAELVIPIQYRTVQLQGEELEPVSFEKDIIIEFKKFQAVAKEAVLPQAKLRVGPTYSFKQGDKRVEHMWDVTHLTYNIGETSIDSLECRFGTKLNISWAFDIIHYIYNNLKGYNNNFIKTLRNIIQKAPSIPGKPSKMDTFIFGLSLIGIPIEFVIKDDEIKGGMVETITEVKQEPTRVIRYKLKGQVEPVELIEILALKNEYNDMIAHLEFMIDIIYLYSYDSKIPRSAFELFGLKAYDRFFKRVFGTNYEVSGLSGLAAIRRQEQSKMKGGYNPFQSDLIQNVFATEGKEQTQLNDKITPVFDNVNFLTTQFSIINLYEEIITKEDEEALKARIERIAGLRPSDSRQILFRELNEKKLYIIELISQIKNEESTLWTDRKLTGIKRSRNENNRNLGETRRKKPRVSGGTKKRSKKYKFKTFKKKLKTNRKTQRR